jgi:hypothetical protein
MTLFDILNIFLEIYPSDRDKIHFSIHVNQPFVSFKDPYYITYNKNDENIEISSTIDKYNKTEIYERLSEWNINENNLYCTLYHILGEVTVAFTDEDEQF